MQKVSAKPAQAGKMQVGGEQINVQGLDCKRMKTEHKHLLVQQRIHPFSCSLEMSTTLNRLKCLETKIYFTAFSFLVNGVTTAVIPQTAIL